MFSQTKTDLKLRIESVEPLVKSAKSAVSWSIGCKGENSAHKWFFLNSACFTKPGAGDKEVTLKVIENNRRPFSL